jgi:hypothetical protein
MADEEKHEPPGDGGDAGGGGKKSLVQQFKDEPKWVKIGALAGVAVLGITVLLYFKNQGAGNTPTTTPTDTTGSTTTPGMGAPTELPGEGDVHPSLPPGSGSTTPAKKPKPAPKPKPKPIVPVRQVNPTQKQPVRRIIGQPAPQTFGGVHQGWPLSAGGLGFQPV